MCLTCRGKMKRWKLLNNCFFFFIVFFFNHPVWATRPLHLLTSWKLIWIQLHTGSEHPVLQIKSFFGLWNRINKHFKSNMQYSLFINNWFVCSQLSLKWLQPFFFIWVSSESVAKSLLPSAAVLISFRSNTLPTPLLRLQPNNHSELPGAALSSTEAFFLFFF